MHYIDRFIIFIAFIITGCAQGAYAEPLTIAHPDNADARIEYFENSPSGTGPWPVIIFLHGHQELGNRIGGQAFENWGVLKRYASKGYLAVSVSLPGYGGSSGPEDFAGPFTQHAVQAVIAKLRADDRIIADKVVIEGISLGAVTGALVAARDEQIAGLVLISGLYDLPAFFAQPKSVGAASVKASAVQLTGGSSKALLERSAMPLASQIRASTLILNGAKDDRTDADQSRHFAQEINRGGGKAVVHIYPDFGHQIPVKTRDAQVDAFIHDTLLR